MTTTDRLAALDNPAWATMSTAQAHLANVDGGAARYPADIGPFAGLAGDDGWPALARLSPPDAEPPVVVGVDEIPRDWEFVRALPGVQLIGPDVAGRPDPEIVPLTVADVPAMLDLVERTQPGPFRRRTIELGGYIGIKADGALIAMAGERMHPPGWTEISAVCTDPAHQGQGLAGRLILATVAGIRARGELPFLHTAATNTTAIRLYEHLGFTLRRRITFASVRPVVHSG